MVTRRISSVNNYNNYYNHINDDNNNNNNNYDHYIIDYIAVIVGQTVLSVE